MVLRPITIAIIAGFALSPFPAGSAELSDLLKQYIETYRQQFSELKPTLVPLNRGSVNYRVGDLWDPSLTRLLQGVDTCFPGLTPRKHPDTIGSITLHQTAGIGFLLRLKSLFDFSGKASGEASIKVDFVDVVEEAPEEADLRRRHDPTLCPMASPLLDEGKVAENAEIPVIIGRLYRGKRRIVVTYETELEANAKLTEIGELIAGAPAEIEAGAKYGSDRSIVISDREPVPLAFAPAFVPVLTTFMGGKPHEASYVWMAFEPLKASPGDDLLSDLKGVVAENWTWADD
jgi:hypothetical protein